MQLIVTFRLSVNADPSNAVQKAIDTLENDPFAAQTSVYLDSDDTGEEQENYGG